MFSIDWRRYRQPSKLNEEQEVHIHGVVRLVVALPGIEPGSGASETLILSIVLQGL